MIVANMEKFFSTARERHNIYRQRAAGEPPPWTKVPLFRMYRMCNVFRELDRTTVWFNEHLRSPLRNEAARVLFATVAFRWLNRIESAQRVLPLLGNGVAGWDRARFLQILKDVHPLVTGSYIIKNPNGMPKCEGIAYMIERFAEKVDGYAARWAEGGYPTLESLWRELREEPFQGDFMSYEVVSDLRHTCWLDKATDIMTWANPGPGCARGLSWLLSGNMEHFNRGGKADRDSMMSLMQGLLQLSREPHYWPPTWPQWEMREAEHWACEIAKIIRAWSGGAPPKQLFHEPKS